VAFVDSPWDGSASRFPDTASYCKSCLIDENEPGQDKVQAKCSLPVSEPNGDVNVNALSAAAGRLGQTKASPASKKKAARKLLNLYRQAKKDVPDTLKNMAQ
jgi:hypothetical protein